MLPLRTARTGSTPLASRLRPPLRGGLRPGKPSRKGDEGPYPSGASADEACPGKAPRSGTTRVMLITAPGTHSDRNTRESAGFNRQGRQWRWPPSIRLQFKPCTDYTASCGNWFHPRWFPGLLPAAHWFSPRWGTLRHPVRRHSNAQSRIPRRSRRPRGWRRSPTRWCR